MKASIFLMLGLACASATVAQTQGYKCISGNKTEYQDSPCAPGQQQNTVPLTTSDAKAQAQAQKQLEKDQKRADAFMDRTRQEQNKAAERRHEQSLQDKKLETAKLRKEAAQLERDAQTSPKSENMSQPKKKRVFRAKVAKQAQ
jgi:hypothetical protein